MIISNKKKNINLICNRLSSSIYALRILTDFYDTRTISLSNVYGNIYSQLKYRFIISGKSTQIKYRIISPYFSSLVKIKLFVVSTRIQNCSKNNLFQSFDEREPV